jgi:hypothetical protein
MAGVKGRSGGARPGAGRKPGAKAASGLKVARVVEAGPVVASDPIHPAAGLVGGRDMLQMLQDVALGVIEATPTQVRAAIAAVQYTHTKRGDGGKKDEQADKAKKAATGKFRAAPAPLKLVRGA